MDVLGDGVDRGRVASLENRRRVSGPEPAVLFPRRAGTRFARGGCPSALPPARITLGHGGYIYSGEYNVAPLMVKIAFTIVVLLLATPALAAKEGKAYEEGIRELSDNIVTDVVKEKHPSVAVMDFTDLNGKVTPLGRFVAEELSSSLVVTGEVQVVDRTQFGHVLEKENISHSA